jgi:prepilin-type N-terminal cleavage/methylation domain-containing protein
MRVQTGSSALRPTGKHLGCRRDQRPTLKAIPFLRFRSGHLQAGYTLVEVVIATAVIAMVYGMIIQGYMQAGLRAQWSGYSLAAQSLATQQIEQARAAMWDPVIGNQVTNLSLLSRSYTGTNQTWTGYTTAYLDVPYATTNYVVATNFISIQLFYLDPPQNMIPVQMIRVDTVWPFFYRKDYSYFTNTSATLLAPDNRDQSTL